ncbi:SMP-30/gluconolactonase/LRE family protein [Erythrobacter sp. NE805]|uniref:SMP-30/gluconolactonase/LRE family protein n=1 Tax=Erythrobacter sp. NE805 TaxID=3389875 RepID=UPI00396B07AB
MIRRIAGLALLGPALGVAGLIAFSPIDPVAWTPPPPLPAGQTCATAPRLTARVLAKDLPGKPDGLAFDNAGRLLVAIANGEVAAVDPASGAWSIAARGGGSLTGLADGQDGTIYAVDERAGTLLAAPPGGTFRRVLDRVGSTRLSWTNDVTALPDGSIAFTTTATGRSLDDFYHEVLEHRGSGLLVRYDPASGKARVLARGLAMTNGVAAMPDGNLLVADSANYGVSLFSPEGKRLAQLTGLPGFTGNVRASDRPGRYWVTLLSPRSRVVDGTAPYPSARRLLAWLPSAVRPQPQPLPCLVEISRAGRTLTPRLLAIDGAPTSFSTAIERDGRLYLSPASIAPGSTAQVYVAEKYER